MSVDPLAPEYPELTTYQFAGNTPIQAIDRDGLEPAYAADGRLIYSVQPNQGLVDVANDLNSAETQERYGYTLIQPVTWRDLATNPTNFANYVEREVEQGNITYEQLSNRSHKAWYSMNMNPKDRLEVDGASRRPEPPAPTPPRPPRPIGTLAGTSYSSTIGGGSVGVGAGGGGVSGDIFRTRVPRNSPFWEGGQVLTIYGVSGGIGSAGVSGSGGAGRITFNYDGMNSSVISLLNEPAITGTAGGAYFIGGKIILTDSREGGYSMWQIHIMMGGKLDASISTGLFGDITVPEFDSLERAREVQETHGVGANPEMDQFIIDRTEEP